MGTEVVVETELTLGLQSFDGVDLEHDLGVFDLYLKVGTRRTRGTSITDLRLGEKGFRLLRYWNQRSSSLVFTIDVEESSE